MAASSDLRKLAEAEVADAQSDYDWKKNRQDEALTRLNAAKNALHELDAFERTALQVTRHAAAQGSD